MRFIGIAIGFYLGLLCLKPIDNWEVRQRNLSGQILTSEIENYKQLNGVYPDSLSQLDIDKLNKVLPKTYQMDRFTYFVKESNYDLDIPIPIFDRWHWDKDKKVFEYSDF
jgi:hypothetical protein